eukprot:1094784-Prorocentrum_minimum.AAC.1
MKTRTVVTDAQLHFKVDIPLSATGGRIKVVRTCGGFPRVRQPVCASNTISSSGPWRAFGIHSGSARTSCRCRAVSPLADSIRHKRVQLVISGFNSPLSDSIRHKRVQFATIGFNSPQEGSIRH